MKNGGLNIILAAAVLLAAAPNVWAMGDPASGEKVFRKCRACHEVGEDAKHKTGPLLNGIVGGTIAAQEGFKYSNGLLAYGEGVYAWTDETLDAFLANPRQLVRGTRMSFSGLRNEADRADVIAYLATFGDADPAEDAGTFSVTPEVLALQGDVDYGEYLSGECTTCHRAGGTGDEIPSIAGLEYEPFVVAMHAYRAGARQHPVMQMIAGRLSDEEIAALAAFFNALEN